MIEFATGISHRHNGVFRLSTNMMFRFFMLLTSFTATIFQAAGGELRLERDVAASTIKVFRAGETSAIVTQHARANFRPYIHPIVAPDGKGFLTEYQPGHHKHQTGLYWGFTRLNGRDYFHHPDGKHWKRVGFSVLKSKGVEVVWETVYSLLDKQGKPVLTETQHWRMRADKEQYTLDLTWKGKAEQKTNIGKYDYGGLFLRMPWRKGINGQAVNSRRLIDANAEGKRDIWVDVGMQVEGRNDMAHIAIFDHPKNKGYPQPWRVDNQLGIGPVRARLGDWQIPQGKTETIQHRLLVYNKQFSNKELTEQWKRYTGKKHLMDLWKLAQNEGRKATFLSPNDAVKAMTTVDGVKVNLFAGEPMIRQPMAFCWDDRGRLWIAENRDYESRGKGFSNSGDSRIIILEDTDQDGKADKQTVFAEGIAFPAAIAVGFGGLWLGAPPNLLFIPDQNGDDKGELEKTEVRLTGWGIRDRHETLNSFHWGPDGWLYGCQGFATPSRVGKPKQKGRIFRHNDPFPKKIEFKDKPVDINGGVWRYHPTKDRFEVVAHGFSNPWGIDYDAKGNLFITACVIPHMFHVVPGGIYHRQGGKHFNPYVYQDIRTIVDHSHRSAHGGARIYLSDAFPKKHHGRLFMCNLHEHAVLSDILTPKGSGFIASHGDDFVRANNAQWVGFSMELGPDGALYALDWHDADICGKEVLNKDTGRIFRITPASSTAIHWKGRYDDLSKMSDVSLVRMQLRQSSWHARRARVILQHRASSKPIAEEALQLLHKIFTTKGNSNHRLRAMWALHVTQGLTHEKLDQALNDSDEYIRGWAIQILCEDKSPGERTLKRFASLASNDASAVVRLKLAACLQRLPHPQRWDIARALLTHEEDAGDHNIPKMVWFGIEPLVPEKPALALELASASNIPLVSEFISRRATEADAFKELVNALKSSPSRKTLAAMLKGMRDGLVGRRGLTPPAGWRQFYSQLSNGDRETRQLATEISRQFGMNSVTEILLTAVTDKRKPSKERNVALRSLASQKDANLAKIIPKLLNDPAVRVEAIRAIAAYDLKPLGQQLLKQYQTFSTEEKLEAVQTLASRPAYGWQLTQAIKLKTIPRRDVPSYIARQLHRVVGSGFLEVWGSIDTLPDEKKAAYAKYLKILTNSSLAKADTIKGRRLFQRTCMACHKLHGEGGIVGPDITGANRNNLSYLLDNILDPSGVIQDDYKLVTITTRSGRTLAGNVVAENKRTLTLRIVGQEIVITKSEIQSRETSAVSLMPDGLLNSLKDSEVIDLMAYLQTINPPKEKDPIPARRD